MRTQPARRALFPRQGPTACNLPQATAHSEGATHCSLELTAHRPQLQRPLQPQQQRHERANRVCGLGLCKQQRQYAAIRSPLVRDPAVSFYQQSFFVAARRVDKRPSEAALFNPFDSAALRSGQVFRFAICRFFGGSGLTVATFAKEILQNHEAFILQNARSDIALMI